jgi:hypothetical protein
VYTVTLKDHAVSDFSGNYAAGDVLGSFKVTAPVPDRGGRTLMDSGYMGIMTPGYNQTIQDYASKGDRHDFYRLRVKSNEIINSKLYGMTENVNLQLLDGHGHVIRTSAKAGTTSDRLSQAVSRGTYYLHVSYAGPSSTEYSLRISQSSRQ